MGRSPILLPKEHSQTPHCKPTYQSAIGECRMDRPIVFQKVSAARAKVIRRKALWILNRKTSRLSDQMSYPTAWNIPDSPARLMCIEAKVDVFIMRIVALIQNADVLEYLATDDHRGAAYPIHLASVVRHR